MSRAMWPNTDKRRLLIKSITGGKLVRPCECNAFQAFATFVNCDNV